MIGQYAKNVAFNGSESSDISESFPVISPPPDIIMEGGGVRSGGSFGMLDPVEAAALKVGWI